MAFFTDKFLNDRREELLRSVQRSQSELAALRTQLGEREQTARQTQQALKSSARMWSCL